MRLPYRPVDQTIFTVPGGNCFSACVATLLGLSIEEVPYFMGMTEEEGQGWWERFNNWLATRDFYAFDIPAAAWKPQGGAWAIMSGKSPRGDFDHSVVSCGGEVWHDPHPSRAGLQSIKAFTVLVPFLPLDGVYVCPLHGPKGLSIPACPGCDYELTVRKLGAR